MILDAWREDYNAVRPHSALQDRTPAAVGAMWVNEGNWIELETPGRFVTISPA